MTSDVTAGIHCPYWSLLGGISLIHPLVRCSHLKREIRIISDVTAGIHCPYWSLLGGISLIHPLVRCSHLKGEIRITWKIVLIVISVNNAIIPIMATVQTAVPLKT